MLALRIDTRFSNITDVTCFTCSDFKVMYAINLPKNSDRSIRSVFAKVGKPIAGL